MSGDFDGVKIPCGILDMEVNCVGINYVEVNCVEIKKSRQKSISAGFFY